MFFCKKSKKKLSNEISQKANEEIKSLKNHVEGLLNERITPAIINAADKAEKVAHSTKEMTDIQMQQVSGKVKSKPLVAIFASAVIGFILGRVIR